MTISLRTSFRIALLAVLLGAITTFSIRTRAETAACNGINITIPFTDVAGANIFFCSIASAYFTALTSGTTATTYSPAAGVTREQMAAFITRTLDQSLRRGHSRAALGQWWGQNKTLSRLRITTGGVTSGNLLFLATDGHTVWAADYYSNRISGLDISTWEIKARLVNATAPQQMIIVSGYVYTTSFTSPGRILIHPTWVKGDSTIDQIDATVGNNPVGITFDGENLWTANFGTDPGNGSISKVAHCGNSCNVTTYSTGFSRPVGILFDGANLWVTDRGDATLKRVDRTNGTVLQTIPLGGTISIPVFDGANLWIPCAEPDKLFVVRGVGGLMGTVLAQLTGNGLNGAFQASFDGERIAVSSYLTPIISLWKATDLSPLGFVDVFPDTDLAAPGICSDGVDTFVGLSNGAITRL